MTHHSPHAIMMIAPPQTSGKTKGHMDEWVGALITARGAEAVQVSPLYPFAAGHRSDTGAAASAVAGGKATGDVTLYTPVDFEEWEEFTLQDTPHAELMGYKPFPVPVSAKSGRPKDPPSQRYCSSANSLLLLPSASFSSLFWCALSCDVFAERSHLPARAGGSAYAACGAVGVVVCGGE